MGAGWGMNGAALYLDLLILALLFVMLARSHFKGEEVHQRLDDVIEGIGSFATELLTRTQILMEKAAPAIELHNHNPLEQLFKFVQSMKTGQFGNEMNNNPRDDAGRYATPPQIQEDSPTPEVIDISD